MAKSSKSKADAFLYLVVGVVAVAAVLLGFRTYRTIDRNLTAAALSGRAAIAYLAAATLSEEFHRFGDLGRSLATRADLSRLVSSARWSDAIGKLQSVPADFASVDQVLITDVAGTLRAVYPDVDDDVGTSLRMRAWYPGVTKSWTAYVSPIYSRSEAEPQRDMALAVPIRSSDGEPAGILVLRTRFENFFAWTRRLRLDRDGAISIVDSAGRQAFDSGETEFSSIVDLTGLPGVRQVMSGESGVHVDVAGGAATQVTAYAPAAHGWGAVARWPYRAVFATRDDQLRRITSASIVVMLMALTALYFFMRARSEHRTSALHLQAATELERRVAERTEALQRSNEDLESFSYSVSHDLRAPLRAIGGYADILNQDYGKRLNNDGTRILGELRGNVERMSALIDDLLGLARVRAAKPNLQHIEMSKLVNEVVAEARKSSMRVPKIDVHGLPDAEGDPILIRQVWANLIDNACKYSGDVETPTVTVSGIKRESEIEYCVADNGIGFAMTDHSLLFRPFSRLQSAARFSGTGVGLAIVKRIVEHHGGRIWAQSEPGQGTQMYFALPAAPESDQEEV